MMDKLRITTKRKLQAVPYDDIIYMEKFGRIIRLHTEKEELDFYGKYSEILPQLGSRFTNPHESYLINMAFIVSIDSSGIELPKKTKIGMGKKCLARAKRDYNNYIKEISQIKFQSGENRAKKSCKD